MKKAGASFLPVAVLLVFAALILTFSASFTAASTSASSICDRFPTFSQRFPSCRETPPPPPPADVCPNVPGTQTSGPCADEQCQEQGGTWNGTSCDTPPAPPPPSSGNGRNICERYLSSSRMPTPDQCIPDVCLNVPGKQAEGPCADKLCTDDGATWTGASCDRTPIARITKPAGGETFTAGDPVEIKWEVNNMKFCRVGVFEGLSDLTWITEFPGIPMHGSFLWTPFTRSTVTVQQRLYLLCYNPWPAEPNGPHWEHYANFFYVNPADVCPNVPGTQTESPCADQQCADQGGTWNGNSCLPFVRVTYPNGGEIFSIGEEIEIKWEARNIDYCLLGRSDGPSSLTWINMYIPNTQTSYLWTVASLGNRSSPHGQKIYVTCAHNNQVSSTDSDYSDDFFTVRPADACPNVADYQASGPCADQQCTDQGRTWNGTSCEPPFVRITYPNGGETFTEGDQVEIRWEASRMSSCELVQSPGGGGIDIAGVDSAAGSYNWTARSMGDGNSDPGQKQKILLRCWDSSNAVFEDYSDDFFTVFSIPQCSDAIDNDGDTKIDYPADPNCISASDDSEAYPVLIYTITGRTFTENIAVSYWGDFHITITDEPILLGPISFTITTTGMEEVTKLTNVRIGELHSTEMLSGPLDVPLVNGAGVATFAGPILLDIGTRQLVFHATIPPEERFKVPSGSTRTFTADPAENWSAVGAMSGAEISLSWVPPLVMDIVTITNPDGPPPAKCFDAIDNDLDGETDFPADKGCSDRLDNSEDSSGGAGGGGAGGGGGSSSSGSN